MISDQSGRYALTQLDDRQLWHYDKRWRKGSLITFGDDQQIDVYEGRSHICVVPRVAQGEPVEVHVYDAADPKTPITMGTFDNGTWKFEQDNTQAWALVPEYILLSLDNDAQGLIRIADSAELLVVSELGKVTSVASVPDSRLVVLVGEGRFWLFDPLSKRSFWSQDLAQKNPRPLARFRNPEELWISDLDTMLKLDAKKFEVLDAAGSETSEHVANENGHFGRWSFAAQGELCVVTRPTMGDVLVIDTISMAPVAQGVFNGPAADAILVGRNTLIGVTNEGVSLRARARRIKSFR